jgi:hypothetical protein
MLTKRCLKDESVQHKKNIKLQCNALNGLHEGAGSASEMMLSREMFSNTFR